VDFGLFTIDQIGDDNYTALLRKRQSTDKVDWDVEARRLEEIARDRGLM
jgi:hypothetical protein